MPLKVTVGETYPTSPIATASSTKFTVEAKMWIKHESYDPSSNTTNIGLIYLPVNIVRSSNVAISYLYLNDPEDSTVFGLSFLNQIADIAGWGRTTLFGAVSPTLKKATAKIVSLAVCQTKWSSANAKQICTESVSTTTIQNMCTGK